MRYLFYYLLWLLLLMAGCSHSFDARLTRVAELSETDPEAALAALDSVNREDLGKRDRHYYDFVKIKASDKAYIDHTSDSAILSVLDYFASDGEVGPEALYYGGRVYSDLGDYPTSLSYFQKALDATPAENRRLRGNILSQTARLLNGINLFNEAIPYLEEVIDLDYKEKDTINLIYDNQLLSQVYFQKKEFDKAIYYIWEAEKYTTSTNLKQRARNKMYLAGIKLFQNEIDSALILIRDIPEKVSSQSKGLASIYAADIYYMAGFPDTAMMYAKQVLASPLSHNQQNAYHILLSPDVRMFLPADSIFEYINRYRIVLDQYYNQNTNELALLQQSLYNYNLHEQKRVEAEQKKNNLQKLLVVLVLVSLTLIIISLYLKYRNQKRIVQLQIALQKIKFIKNELESHKVLLSPTNTVSSSGQIAMDSFSKDSRDLEENLRKDLRAELLSLSDPKDAASEVGSAILQSPTYHKFKKFLDAGYPVPEQNELWNELEDLILSQSGSFKKHLMLLAAGNISTPEWQTLMLIKCGFTPAQMAVLLGRNKNTIVSRRKTLSLKIFGENIDTKIFDRIIRSI